MDGLEDSAGYFTAYSGTPIQNRYLGLRARLLLRLLFGRKLSLLKIWNAFACYGAYFLKRPLSAKSPLLINFELWNECNESCVFCRSSDNRIYDVNPAGNDEPISKGKLDFSIYESILRESADRLIMAIPYINGEPLMSRDIYAAIKLANDLRVGTLIASNGILLNETNSRRLLESGLDCLKVHVSGFTQPVHSIEHRRGNVERIKDNLIKFMHLRSALGAKTIVVLDYIRYNHNVHELEEARAFARRAGMLFNVRPGNPRFMEATEPPQSSKPLPKDVPCDWLWTVLSIDWNGAIYPCCNYVVWSGGTPYGNAGAGSLHSVWNGPSAQKMRMIHAHQGRTPIAICSECPQQGVKFKW